MRSNVKCLILSLFVLTAIADPSSYAPGRRVPLSAGDRCSSITYHLIDKQGFPLVGVNMMVGGKGLSCVARTDATGEATVPIPYSNECYGARVTITDRHLLLLTACGNGSLSVRLQWVVRPLRESMPCAAAGTNAEGCIFGTITDGIGRPIEHAELSLVGPYLQGERNAITDEQGQYCFSSIPQGDRYELAVQAMSYGKVIAHYITACPNEPMQVDVALHLWKNLEE